MTWVNAGGLTHSSVKSLYCKNVSSPQINVYICHSKSWRELRGGAEWNNLKFVRIVKIFKKEKWKGIFLMGCQNTLKSDSN